MAVQDIVFPKQEENILEIGQTTQGTPDDLVALGGTKQDALVVEIPRQNVVVTTVRRVR